MWQLQVQVQPSHFIRILGCWTVKKKKCLRANKQFNSSLSHCHQWHTLTLLATKTVGQMARSHAGSASGSPKLRLKPFWAWSLSSFIASTAGVSHLGPQKAAAPQTCLWLRSRRVILSQAAQSLTKAAVCISKFEPYADQPRRFQKQKRREIHFGERGHRSQSPGWP